MQSPDFSLQVTPYPGFHLVDLVSACVVAVTAALAGLALV